MNEFQREHKEWLDRNFPKQTPEFPAVGCVEEAGELMHAVLKCQQSSVWGAEARYQDVDWREKMVDAIGDCAIYACSLCNTNNWEFSCLLAVAEYNVAVIPGTPAFQTAAQLVAAAVVVALHPTLQSSLHVYLKQLYAVCQQFNFSLEDCIKATWKKVRRRARTVTGRGY